MVMNAKHDDVGQRTGHNRYYKYRGCQGENRSCSDAPEAHGAKHSTNVVGIRERRSETDAIQIDDHIRHESPQDWAA